MASDPVKVNPNEFWARRWLETIQRSAEFALSPRPTIPEEVLSPNRVRAIKKEKEQLEKVIALDEASTEMLIHGSRTIMVEDRRLLEGAEKLLRPAFEIIAKEIADRRNSSANTEYLYQKLGELILSAYYIGAYTTITDGAQNFVAPALRKERAEVMRKGKTVQITDEDHKNLRAAIIAVRGDRKLSASEEFGRQIHQEVVAKLGLPKGPLAGVDRDKERGAGGEKGKSGSPTRRSRID